MTVHMKASAHSMDVAKPALSRKADAGEGDVYHGYPMHALAPKFLSSLAEACCTGLQQPHTFISGGTRDTSGAHG